MRIKTRLQVMTVLSAALVATMAVLLYWSHHRLATAIKAEELANEIVGSVFERNILRTDYTINDNERAKDQWFTKQDYVRDLLKRAPSYFETTEDRKTIDNMVRNVEGSAAIFQQVAGNRDLAGKGLREAAQAGEIQNRLVGQLLLRAYDTVADARGLQEAGGLRIQSTQKTFSNLSLAFAGLMAALIAITAWFLGRLLTKGITGLHEGAVTIGAGNLDHRISLRGKDEFSEVAETFNSMAEKLGLSYADLEREIAERKRATAEVENLNQELGHMVSQLQAANIELEAFSYSVSHDLRAPLRAIDSFSRIIIEDYTEKLDDEGREALAFIRDNTRNMGKLIDDLLAFSRLGRQEMRTARIDMTRMAHQVFSDIEKTTTNRAIQFRVGELPPVPGDPVLIRQALSNLIENAVKYTSPMDIAVIEVEGRNNGDEHVYSVRDNGVGFEMQYADKLFGVFQRLHGADEFEGTGVGLALVQRIVHRHGGRVWAEGKVGEGATFYFALPAGHSTAAENRNQDQEDTSRKANE